jgi:hypothetical protein
MTLVPGRNQLVKCREERYDGPLASFCRKASTLEVVLSRFSGEC